MGDAYERQTFELPPSEHIADALKRIGDVGWEVIYYHADHSRGSRFTRWVEARRPPHGTPTPKWEYQEFNTTYDGRSEEAAIGGWQRLFPTHDYHHTQSRWLFKRTVV
jgi:hypothetical protein